MANVKKINGKWVADYIDCEGRRHKRQNREVKTEREAKRWLRDLQNEVDDGLHVAPDRIPTFADYACHQLEQRRRQLQPGTWRSWRSIVERVLIPALGRYKLSKITRPMVKNLQAKIAEPPGGPAPEWRRKLKAEPSPKYVNHIIVALGGILQEAVEDGYLAVNPARGIKRLPLGRQEMDFLTSAELKQVIDAAPDPLTRELITVAALTGLRRGELLGLRWEDIDFEAKQLQLRRQFTGGQLTDVLKTKASYRVVDLPATVVRALRERHMRLGRPSEEALVWDRGDGVPIDPDNLTKRLWRAALRAAGLRETIRWHDLRHTYASLSLLAAGNMKYIQAQLGHSGIQITMDRYAHLMPETRREAVEQLEQLYEGGV